MYALVVIHSFDSEMPVMVFDTYKQACAELKKQYEEELKIQQEKNENEIEYEQGEKFAQIVTIFGTTMWTISKVLIGNRGEIALLGGF